MPCPLRPSTDVLIIGRSTAALSTALHLHQRGVEKIGIVSPPLDSSHENRSKFVSKGFLDNFTRLTNTHGLEKSKNFWSFGDQAFDQLMSFCHAHAIPVATGDRVRAILTSQEFDECQIAIDELQKTGLSQTLVESLPPSHPLHLTSSQKGRSQGERSRWNPSSAQQKSYCGFQIDSGGGAILAPKALHSVMAQGLENIEMTCLTPVALASGEDGIRVETSQGKTLRSEMAVLADHQSVRALLPELRDAVVPHTELWIAATPSHLPAAEGEDSTLMADGTAFSQFHGHEWGTIAADGSIQVAGARYLQESMGIEDELTSHPRGDARVYERLAEVATTLVGTLSSIERGSYQSCRICDELPLVGPHHVQDRVLLATGFMGCDLSQGFYAGSCLAELITSGTCSDLPREFWPERLRSISSE